MVWYVLLRPLTPELDGHLDNPFQICGGLCQTRKTTLEIRDIYYKSGKKIRDIQIPETQCNAASGNLWGLDKLLPISGNFQLALSKILEKSG
jgi:hypothetical protein